ncbi:hypothetical protein [Arthrobacter sp. TMN-50]
MSEGLGGWDEVNQDTSPETVDPQTTTTAEATEAAPSLVFATVDLFVQEHLALNYRRNLTAQGGTHGAPSGGGTVRRSAA